MDQPTEEEAPRFEPVKKRNRLLIMLASFLAVAVVGLSSWVVYDQTRDSGSAVDGEIEQLLADYLRAYETSDPDAVRAAVTEDFVLNEYIYEMGADGVSMAERVESGIDGILTYSLTIDWEIEQVGEAIITGDGPWFVSIEENWVNPRGLVGFTHLDGVASYVIVDEGDALKIANHYWAGLDYDTE